MGRDQDIVRLSDILLRPECRLLTLLGLGGMGKTRLALAVAEAVAADFPDGVCFVDLTKVSHADVVPSYLAAHLDPEIKDLATEDRIYDYLSDRHMLLVLDNFEHVLPAAVVVGQILERCPGVTILATSREPLHLRWEWRLPISPLAIPNLNDTTPVEELLSNPSVALFVERASALDLHFEASPVMLSVIAAVCARLEGVPLAIELAAARTRVLSPVAILKRLEDSAAVLKQQVLDVPARHQSLQAALEWSYRLLSSQEQCTFRRLGRFVGSFSLGAAVKVTGAPGESQLLELLSSLVDKGLLTLEPTEDGEPRFRLLATVRSYALEQLEDDADKGEVASAHARYYLSLAEAENARTRHAGYFVFAPRFDDADAERPGHAPWPAILDREQANVRVALEWAQRHDAVALIRLASALAWYWWVRGHLREGTHWLELALERNPRADEAVRGGALGGLGIMYRQQGQFERARSLLEEGVGLARHVSEPLTLSAQLVNLGGVLESERRLSEATALVEEAVELARAQGDRWQEAVALTYLGWAAILRRDGKAAEGLLSASLSLFRELGDVRSSIVVTASLARGQELQEALEQAIVLLEDPLRECRELGQHTVTAFTLEVTACVLSTVALPEDCAQLLGAADALREYGYSRVTLETDICEQALEAIKARAGDRAAEDNLTQGRTLTAEGALDKALELVQQESSKLPVSPGESRSVQIAPLSGRERQVLELLGAGCSNKEIGRRLDITENTAKFHVTKIFEKLGVGNRAEAVRVAISRGLLRQA